MKEYNDTKSLRRKYPIDLTEDHMSEIIALLPEKPARDDMVSLGLAYNDEFTTKEIILYWMYQEKLTKSICAECLSDLKSIDDRKREEGEDQDIFTEKNTISRNALARSQGGLLKVLVANVLKNDGAKNDIDFEKKKELAENIFNTWKNGTPKKFFKLQLVGYRNLVVINVKVFGKTEINDFLNELAK